MGRDEIDGDDASWDQDEESAAWCEHPAPVSMALLVGDDRRELEAWRGALGDLGYDVLAAPDAERALAILQGLGNVELLVTDAGLAATGGLDLIVAARLFDATLPIVAVGGGGRGVRRGRGQAAVLRGADAVVARPCTRWQFMDAVDAACALTGSSTGPLQSANEDEPSDPA